MPNLLWGRALSRRWRRGRPNDHHRYLGSPDHVIADAAQEHPADALPAAAADDDDVGTLGGGRGQDRVGRLALPHQGRRLQPPLDRVIDDVVGPIGGHHDLLVVTVRPRCRSAAGIAVVRGRAFRDDRQDQQPAARVVGQVQGRLDRGVTVVAAIGGDQDRPEACHGLPLSPGRMSRHRVATILPPPGQPPSGVVAGRDRLPSLVERPRCPGPRTRPPNLQRTDPIVPDLPLTRPRLPRPVRLRSSRAPTPQPPTPVARRDVVLGDGLRWIEIPRPTSADGDWLRSEFGFHPWTWRTSSPATSDPSWTPTTTTCSW